MSVNLKSIKIQNLTAKASVYTVPNEKNAFILSFFITNKSDIDASSSVMIRSGGIDYYLIKDKVISSSDSSFQPNDGRKIILTSGDMIYLESTETIDIIISILET